MSETTDRADTTTEESNQRSAERETTEHSHELALTQSKWLKSAKKSKMLNLLRKTSGRNRVKVSQTQEQPAQVSPHW